MASSMDKFREAHFEQLSAARRDAEQRVSHQLTLSEKGLGAIMVANGGALIGLFTFIGNVVSKPTAIHFDLRFIWCAFACFCIGVSATLLAFLCAFLSQDRFYFQSNAEIERHRRTLAVGEVDIDVSAETAANVAGMRFYYGGVFCALIAFISFTVGCGFALAGVLPA